MTWYDWVGKVSHWELCKKLKFDPAYKWFLHKPKSILENDRYKILWNFVIQMDHVIPAVRFKKKKVSCHVGDFAIPVDYWGGKSNKMKK